MWASIAQFRWIDAVDVVIVAFAVYQLLLMFKGTKAVQMILGLVLVYFASRIALRGGLLTVNWVLQNLLGVWFLLIIILFQPELRRALASFGLRSRLLRAFARHEEAHMIDEIVRTVSSLAAKRSEQSSSWSGRRSSPTLSSPAYELTRRCRSDCWNRSSIPARRCTTGQLSSNADEWLRPLVSSR
jgi:hypothetical protein